MLTLAERIQAATFYHLNKDGKPTKIKANKKLQKHLKLSWLLSLASISIELDTPRQKMLLKANRMQIAKINKMTNKTITTGFNSPYQKI